MRILHLPVASGRYAWGQSRAERRMGHQSDVVVFEPPPYQLPADRILFEKCDGIVRQELKRWRLFLSSIFRYDVFHFHFGQKFFVLCPRPFKKGDSFAAAVLRLSYWFYSLLVGRLDLWILKLIGKKIVLTYHGDDIRQGDRSRELYEFSIAAHVGEDYYDDYSDRRKRRMAKIWQRHARQIFVVSPDLFAMVPGGAKLFRSVGVDPTEWSPRERAANPKFLIVHAPSHRLVKGSVYIETAVARLRAKGFDFDFQLIEGLSNVEAKALYEKADLVVDQLLAGWFGIFAAELMAMGKPVICYLREESLAAVSEDFARELPMINASPATIEKKLEWCLTHQDEVRQLGLRSREFALKWFNPDEIAREVVLSYGSKQKPT